MDTFADRILSIRGRMKQGDFAKIIGINPNTLRSYENGRALPNQNILEKICVKFSVNPEWLLLGTGAMYQSKEPGMSGNSAIKDQVILDKRILIEVVEEIENWLNADGSTMPAKAKAELVYQMYMLILEKQADTKQIVQMLNVVRSA